MEIIAEFFSPSMTQEFYWCEIMLNISTDFEIRYDTVWIIKQQQKR